MTCFKLTNEARKNVIDEYKKTTWTYLCLYPIFLCCGDLLLASVILSIVMQGEYSFVLLWIWNILAALYLRVIMWVLAILLKGGDDFSELEFPPYAHYLAVKEKLSVFHSKTIWFFITAHWWVTLIDLPGTYFVTFTCSMDMNQFWELFFYKRLIVLGICGFIVLTAVAGNNLQYDSGFTTKWEFSIERIVVEKTEGTEGTDDGNDDVPVAEPVVNPDVNTVDVLVIA